ncbi:hypothetical protein MO973_44250 [Paenibacillus sp. TRM 82003]|nr:hypothetical protein [Paenibacillus sp. TRM 82003]
MANEKNMNPLSGDRVETDGVYRSPYGHEIELKAGEDYPMDPQYGKVEYEMVAFSYGDKTQAGYTDIQAAADSNVPVSAVNYEQEENTEKRQLKHRLHGGNR